MRAGSEFGRYEIHKRLARGGMGEVWIATAHGPSGFEKKVVIKTILPDLAANPSYISMLINEASLAAQLNHPNIVQTFDLGCINGTYFIAMEFLPGRTLLQLLRKASKTSRIIPAWLSLQIVAACSDALHYAHEFRDDKGEHRGLLHRDMSPGNVMITFAGRTTVLDFGIATANHGDHTQSGTIKGKFHYMPPERIRAEPSDRRGDVYALGVILYQLLTWVRPYEADNDYELLRDIVDGSPTPPSAQASWVPPELEDIVMTAIAKRAEDRFPDAASFAEAVRGFARQHYGVHEPRDIAHVMCSMFAGDPDVPDLGSAAAPADPDEPDIEIVEGEPSEEIESADVDIFAVPEHSAENVPDLFGGYERGRSNGVKQPEEWPFARNLERTK